MSSVLSVEAGGQMTDRGTWAVLVLQGEKEICNPLTAMSALLFHDI
jgi:hypothetical protein